MSDDSFVPDLGMAAFIKMKGFQVLSINRDGIQFVCEDKEVLDSIRKLKIDYLNSEFIEFDSLLMTLKKLPIIPTRNTIDPNIQIVDSLGQSAYIKKLGSWRIEGRYAPNRFGFHVPIQEKDRFHTIQFQWANSDLRNFDACLVALKQLRLKRTRTRRRYKK